MEICSLLKQVNYKEAIGDNKEENWAFNRLSAKIRKKIVFFWEKKHKQQREVINPPAPPSLIGRVLICLGAWIKMPHYLNYLLGYTSEQLWKKEAAQIKRNVMDQFLIEQVQSKITRENQAAQSQGEKQGPRPNFEQASSSVKSTSSALDLSPCGVAHMQGRRNEMEDEDLISIISLNLESGAKEAQIYGILDGHAGRNAAVFAKEHFSEQLKASIEKYNPKELSDVGLFAAFKEAFANLDVAYKKSELEPHDGTTMSVAIILEGNLWVCNLGDTRTILNNGGKAIQLSEDQTCNNPKYSEGVIKRGGEIKYNRVNGMLAIPRAMGDHSLLGDTAKNCVVHTPKITKISLSEIRPGSHLIIACDGVWDVCSSKQVSEFVEANKHRTSKQIAEELINKAYNAGSGDNLSALVLSLG